MGKRKIEDADDDDQPKVKKAKFQVTISGDVILLDGRPEFDTAAKAIKVNQDASAGEVEDRRHMLHWDEQLKGILAEVFTALRGKHGHNEAEFTRALKDPLEKRKWKRLPAKPEPLMTKVVIRVNACVDNLVAGSADVNKAIEIVRERIRGYHRRLLTDLQSVLVDLDDEDPKQPVLPRMKAIAREHFAAEPGSLGIKAARDAIYKQIVEMIEGCMSATDIVRLCHDLQYSVTFDLSPNAKRDNTAKLLKWERLMKASFNRTPAERYEALLTIFD